MRHVARCVAAAALTFLGPLHAGPAPTEEPGLAPAVVERLLQQVEASPERCTAVQPGGADVRTLEADIAFFRQRVPAAAEVPVQLRDCYWDGMAVRGREIVLSVRLARATPAQRFFVIAHEYGHLVSAHRTRLAAQVTQLLRERGSAESASEALRQGALAALSRANETEADAIAVGLMLEAGLDPDEAARLVDPGFATPVAVLSSHPTPGSRAAAIRALAGQRLVSSR